MLDEQVAESAPPPADAVPPVVASPSPAPVEAQPPIVVPRGFTVESALWLALGLLALGMRVVDLGRGPLAEGEAALALEAWRFVSGAPYTMVGAPLPAVLSPLAFNLNALLFLLFGAGDAMARVAQALGGTALVLAPWLLRPVLGRGHALAMSGLLLLSPSVLFWSRHASGEVWAALFALLLVAGVARWHQSGARRELLLAALALGLGLASGAGFWSVLVAGALFALFQRWQARRAVAETGTSEAEVLPLTRSVRTSVGELRAAFMPFFPVTIAAFVVASTGLFVNLPGLGAALNLPVQWLRDLAGVGPSLLIPFLFVVWLYEALALLSAFVGGALMAERRAGWATFALFWVAVTLVPATVSNSGWSGALLFVTLPLALLGAAALLFLGRTLLEEGRWQVEGLFALIGVVLFVYFWLALTKFLTASGTVQTLALVAPLALLGVVALLLAQSFGARAAQRAFALTVLLYLATISLASAWGVSVVRSADPREPLVTQAADADVREGVALLEQVSIERYRDPHMIPLGIQRPLGFVPRWYFRDFDPVTVEGSNADLPEAALLEPDAPPPAGWLGTRVWVGSEWAWGVDSPQLLLRWLTFRADERLPQQDRGALLYIKLPE